MHDRKTLLILAITGLLALAGQLAMWLSYPMPGGTPQHITSFLKYTAPRLFSDLPEMLSARDRALYKSIVAVQKKAEWDMADQLIGKLDENILLGHVLAQRYLSPKHKTSAVELAEWLKAYPDHPQAYDIYILARSKSARTDGVASIRRQPTLQGYGDDSGLAAWSAKSDSVITWHRAMSAWRADGKAQAAGLFASLAEEKSIHAWKKSAAAFWAWRSYSAIGEHGKAARYLQLAAANPRSFYGILANRELKKPLALDKAPITLADSDVLEMMGEPAIRRVIALTESGMRDLAEKELRLVFPKAERTEKLRLMALANKLNLASVQIAMARQLSNDERAYDVARYPVPHWQPHEGFRIDPALIYALARQESGFHSAARSSAGASGIMQLMPKTASLMKKHIKNQPEVTDTVLNVTLGHNYVEHLLGNPLVDGNLLYMLAAYNAGPGRLMEWKKTIDYGNDPLLFLESIPFAETRSYVMQVMTNYWIYAELAGTPSESLHALLKGQWPSYQPSTPMASNLTPRRAG